MRILHPLCAMAIVAALAATPACAAAPAPVATVTDGSAAPVSRHALPATASVDGIGVRELSGLAWDADASVLYGVSDQGYLYRFALARHGGTLDNVRPESALLLRDADHRLAQPSHAFNAEGLALQPAAGGVRLAVALESEPPRIVSFDTRGVAQAELAVPAPANDATHYRKKKHGLESVAFSPAYGLMTAPESPLLGGPDIVHTIYAQGHTWSFPRVTPDSRLKGLEVLADGQLLVLERSRGQSKHELTASLRRVDLRGCMDQGSCKTRTVATLPVGPDNFEGMALLDPLHVLLVSDNGGKAGGDTVFVLVTLP
jgi:hypothetical protein